MLIKYFIRNLDFQWDANQCFETVYGPLEGYDVLGVQLLLRSAVVVSAF